MSPEQLALFGHDLDASSPWELFHREPPSQLVDRLADHRRHDRAVRRRHGGPTRLLRALVRVGLAEEALPAAARLVQALDEGLGR